MVKAEVLMAEVRRRRYTEEFKREAVRLVRESARPVAEVARELGIPDNVLYRWRSAHQLAEAHGTTRGARCDERDELATLKRENMILRQERDFLRRAAAFFAKESR
jgi:transposase